MTPRLRLSILLIAMMLVALVPAAARADTEPNNVISQAEGPIAGGTDITGTIANTSDTDWYVFYAASQQQLHATFADVTESDCLNFQIRDTNGATVSSDYTTPPGTNRYFVEVTWDGFFCSDPPHNYSFRIDPAAGVVQGPALDRALVETTEPNETKDQAQGPLSPGVNYVGGTETANDQDWFYVFIPSGTHQLDVSVTEPDGSSCGAWLGLYSSGSDSSDTSARGSTESFGHINQTVTGPDKLYLQASSDSSDCTPNGRWQLRVETPDAVATTDPFGAPLPPPPVANPVPTGPSYQCRQARKTRNRWVNNVKKTQHQLMRARGKKRHRLARKLRAQKQVLRRARQRVIAYC